LGGFLFWGRATFHQPRFNEQGGLKEMEKETGVVKWFNERKGFGFIVRDSGEGDIFVHHSAIIGEGFKTLNEGDRVEYLVTQGQKGPAAGEVKKL
jgi:CspA family cold shock protein